MKGIEIKDFVFDKGAFGYKVDDVANCLKDISQYVVSLEEKISDYEKKIQDLEEQIENYKNSEESVKEIIVSAQKFKTDIVNEAKEKANKISEDIEQKKLNFDAEINNKTKELMSDARKKADGIMKDTQRKFENETRQLRIMKKEVSDFKARLLSLYKSHLDIITKIPEYDSEEAVEHTEGKSAAINDLNDTATSTDEKQEIKDTEDIKIEHNPVFKVTLTDSDDHIDKGDYIKSRFSELKFGENNN